MHDVIIVGAGPAGCEAAWYCATHGLDTLLLTTSLDSLYWPAAGSAQLEPWEGSLAEAMLASAPADLSAPLRARDLHRMAKEALERVSALHLLQSNVSALLISAETSAVTGVQAWEGPVHLARQVALCTGSFLEGRLSAGQLRETAGRPGEMAYDDLFLNLLQLGFNFELESVEGKAGDYPYLLQSRIFAAAEFGAQQEFALQRHANLFAAGFCARGYLTFPAAALDGFELGRTLVAAA